MSSLPPIQDHAGPKTYLGDGAYARLLDDRTTVVVTAEDGCNVSGAVFLGPSELTALALFCRGVGLGACFRDIAPEVVRETAEER